MTTWGQPKKRSKTTTTRRPAAKPTPAGETSAPSRRNKASAEIRQAMEGREHEFTGVGFIAVGVLLGLAIYFDLAGPLGRGVETVVGWLTGLGRFLVPIALVAIGAALVSKGRSLRRFRLAIGWGLLSLSLLGLLHVVRGPGKIMANFDTLGKAGGWIGALVGEPLRSLIASGGAIVVLVAAVTAIAGVTDTSRRWICRHADRSPGAYGLRQHVDAEERSTSLWRAAHADGLRRCARRGLGGALQTTQATGDASAAAAGHR